MNQIPSFTCQIDRLHEFFLKLNFNPFTNVILNDELQNHRIG